MPRLTYLQNSNSTSKKVAGKVGRVTRKGLQHVRLCHLQPPLIVNLFQPRTAHSTSLVKPRGQTAALQGARSEAAEMCAHHAEPRGVVLDGLWKPWSLPADAPGRLL